MMGDAQRGAVPMTAVTVSGSFKRHLSEIQESVAFFQASGAVVLSPAEPTIVDSFGEFVFVSSDRRRSIKGIQNRHLQCIDESAFLWLVCPDGYVGQSASMEVGWAARGGIPVLAAAPPHDLTLRQYVTVVGDVKHALPFNESARKGSEADPVRPLLVAPDHAVEAAYQELDAICSGLHSVRRVQDEPLEEHVAELRRLVRLPSVH